MIIPEEMIALQPNKIERLSASFEENENEWTLSRSPRNEEAFKET